MRALRLPSATSSTLPGRAHRSGLIRHVADRNHRPGIGAARGSAFGAWAPRPGLRHERLGDIPTAAASAQEALPAATPDPVAAHGPISGGGGLGASLLRLRVVAVLAALFAMAVLATSLGGCAGSAATGGAAPPAGPAPLRPTRSSDTAVPLPSSSPSPSPSPTPVPVSPSPVASPTVTAQPIATNSAASRPSSTPIVASSPTPTGVWMALSPDHGPPGTVVQVTGFAPDGPVKGAAGAPDTASVCWAGCQGLVLDTPVSWQVANPNAFRMVFSVPAVPWLGADGVRLPSPGGYDVGIRCVTGELSGCATKPAQALATFRVTGPVPTPCPRPSCAQVQLSPQSGPPGTLVRVSGRAPVTSRGQVGYTLALSRQSATVELLGDNGLTQAPGGELSGSFRLPVAAGALGLLIPGPYAVGIEPPATISGAPRPAASPPPPLVQATFQVTAAPSWASLGALRPLWVEPSAEPARRVVTGDPSDARRLAYCARGGIRVSSDGGATWMAVPTDGVAALDTSAAPLATGGGQPPTCQSVTLDPAHADSFFASFRVTPAGGPPPVFLEGFATVDRGRSWQRIPAPLGHPDTDFGGFWPSPTSVEALFRGPSGTSTSLAVFDAERTADGGATWAPAPLACPAVGPCVRWGPAPPPSTGMGAPQLQPILFQGSDRRGWNVPAWPRAADLGVPGPHQLVSLSPTLVALISPSGDYPIPVLATRDGGATWSVVALPPYRGTSSEPARYPELQALPSGSLLAFDRATNAWQLLGPGSSAWCPVAPGVLPIDQPAFRAIGDRLWWLDSGPSADSTATPLSAPIAAVVCGR